MYNIAFDGIFPANMIDKTQGAEKHDKFLALTANEYMGGKEAQELSLLLNTPAFYENEYGIPVFVAHNRPHAQALMSLNFLPFSLIDMPVMVYRYDRDKIYVPASDTEYLTLYHTDKGDYVFHHCSDNRNYGQYVQTLERLIYATGINGAITVTQDLSLLPEMRDSIENDTPPDEDEYGIGFVEFNISRLEFIKNIIDSRLEFNTSLMKRVYSYEYGLLKDVTETEISDQEV